MPLDPRQQWALECFFPGLIQKLEALGPGRFEPQKPTTRPRGSGFGQVDLRVRYFLEDTMYLELHVHLKLGAGKTPLKPGMVTSVELKDWSRLYYTLSYQKQRGVNQQGQRLFACDFNKDGRHVHMLPDISEHVHVDETDPDTSDIDPRLFVDLIARYRQDKIYPVQRVARKRNKR